MERKERGQKPITLPIALWILLLVFCWAMNSVVVKFVVADMPYTWGAFLRFLPAYPFVVGFILMQRGVSLKVNLKQFILCTALSVMSFTQIILFCMGSEYTTGGRVTMLIFTYPLIVPFIAHFMVKEERLDKRIIIGSVIAFLGLLIPLHGTLTEGANTLKGDILELLSSVTLSFLIVTNKYAFSIMNKWTVFFWQSTVNILFFGIAALLTPGFHPSEVGRNAWFSLLFQALVISVFAFLSYQYILSKHNSSKVAIFFFATPLLGMLLGGVLLSEAFEISLFIGCIGVALGIYIANRNRE